MLEGILNFIDKIKITRVLFNLLSLAIAIKLRKATIWLLTEQIKANVSHG